MTVTHICGDNPDACFCVYDPACNDKLKETDRFVSLNEIVSALEEAAGDVMWRESGGPAAYIKARFGR